MAYDSNFSCVLQKTGPLTDVFNCTDPNHVIEVVNYYFVAPILGVGVVVASLLIEYRRDLKYEFWVTMSVVTLALVIMPLYTLVTTAIGQPTGLHEALFKLSGAGPYILTNEYRAPVITGDEQFALSLMSTVSGIATGPILDRAWRSRRKEQRVVGEGFPIRNWNE